MTEATPKSAAVEKMSITILETALKQFKAAKKPYAELPENDQRVIIHELDYAIRRGITEAVDIIAADKRTVVAAALDKVTFKDGCQAVLKMGKGASADVHNLADSTGQKVLLVLLNAGKYMDGELPQPDKNQKALFDKSRAARVDGKKNLRTKRSGKRK